MRSSSTKQPKSSNHVRGVKWGQSFACDRYGRIVASVDDRRGDNGVMIASVPARHTTTVYSRIVDALAWTCPAGLGAVAILAVSRRRILNTTDTPLDRERTEFGDPLETIWRRCILRYCGVQTVVRRTYGVVVTSTPEVRRGWLDDTAAQTRALFPAVARAPQTASGG